jgi:hypothetical protein
MSSFSESPQMDRITKCFCLQLCQLSLFFSDGGVFFLSRIKAHIDGASAYYTTFCLGHNGQFKKKTETSHPLKMSTRN